MKRALVVIDDTDKHRELFAEAVEIVRGTDAELELFSWVTPDEFESDVETLEAAEQAGGGTYSNATANDIVTNFAHEFAEAVCGSNLPQYDVSSAVTEDDAVAEHILDAARQSDCDHIFLVGRRRSPTGKVLFGDVAQEVILNFDGNVTVSMS
ncbi:universal stress protein UspA [Haloarcula mannanilytica]|uniref:Universal stress protein UspA n=1 Tax=Haloarcula mannanilytica TaxID=2509225 RepID=A0A4C2EU30_9EURY|nr:universal stress protein [Haloarcula mannanilytica]GCF16143.1 universal stress protein UspA [Haloarcula mannanilytica]